MIYYVYNGIVKFNNAIVNMIGKPAERQGRKAKGLRSSIILWQPVADEKASMQLVPRGFLCA